jgi:hypothetical protein
MNSMVEFLLAISLWIIFISALCVQFIKNFRCKSTRGMNDQFLFVCLNCTVLSIIFIFSQHVLFVYALMGIAALCSVCALIVQRIAYHVPDSLHFFYGVLINSTALLMSVPYLLFRN